MEHPGDIEILEHAAGHLPADRARAVESHAAACTTCRRALAEARAIREHLTAWPEPASHVDLSARVVAAARRESAFRPVLRLGFLARAAAAIVVAAGAGYFAGRADRPAAPVEAVAAEAVAEDLHLSILTGEPAGLALAVLEPPMEDAP